MPRNPLEAACGEGAEEAEEAAAAPRRGEVRVCVYFLVRNTARAD